MWGTKKTRRTIQTVIAHFSSVIGLSESSQTLIAIGDGSTSRDTFEGN
jgi:hypothetical protein